MFICITVCIIRAGKLQCEAKCLHLIIDVLPYYMISSCCIQVWGFISFPVYLRFQYFLRLLPEHFNGYETWLWQLASVDVFVQFLCEMSKVIIHLLVKMWLCCIFKFASRNPSTTLQFLINDQKPCLRKTASWVLSLKLARHFCSVWTICPFHV